MTVSRRVPLRLVTTNTRDIREEDERE